MWLSVRAEHGATVFPLNDLMQHERSDDCPCGPTWTPCATLGDITWLLTHHSLDGRETHE